MGGVLCMNTLKRVVIKEELVELTGDFKKAIILNQMIYWSERVRDFDLFINEERKRMKTDGQDLNLSLQNGWIYKTAEDLSEETMLGLSASNMRKHLKELIKSGWIDERTNPKHKWDRTKQYRVNIAKIQKDLQKLGYALEGYPLYTDNKHFSKQKMHDNQIENASSKIENGVSVLENQTSQNEKAIPEITSEITNIDNNNIEDLSDTDKKSDVVVDGVTNQVISLDTIIELKHRIDSVAHGSITLQAVCCLVKQVGIDCVIHYIEIFPAFLDGKSINNTIGFFIKACSNQYSLPTKSTNKDNFSKYEQHKYTENELNNLFEDLGQI